MTCKIYKDGWKCQRAEGHEGPCAMNYENRDFQEYSNAFDLMATFKGEDWTEIIEMFPELKKQINSKPVRE